MADFDLDFTKIDLYDLFGIEIDASEAAIKKAYRKKALKYHPDKNRDNPKAHDVFQKLSKALEVLTDQEARASYDKVLRAKKERDAKNAKLDAKRRKLKQQLDAREKVAQEEAVRSAQEQLRHEIERIRKEGSKQLEEENLLLQKKLEAQAKEQNDEAIASAANRIKIRRKCKTVKLTESLMRQEFAPFGNILFVIVANNGKSAILEFEHNRSLQLSKDNCPSQFEAQILSSKVNQSNKQDKLEHCHATMATSQAEDINTNHEDYEDFVFRQMLQAENNKRKADD